MPRNQAGEYYQQARRAQQIANNTPLWQQGSWQMFEGRQRPGADMISGLVPMGNSGWYATPNEPISPLDCDNYPTSPYCSGIVPVRPRMFGLVPGMSSSDAEWCIHIDPVLFFLAMPRGSLCYREPACRIPPGSGGNRGDFYGPLQRSYAARPCVYRFIVSFTEGVDIAGIISNLKTIDIRGPIHSTRFVSDQFRNSWYLEVSLGASNLRPYATTGRIYIYQRRYPVYTQAPPYLFVRHDFAPSPTIQSVSLVPDDYCRIINRRTVCGPDCRSPTPIPPPPFAPGDPEMPCSCDETNELLRIIAQRLSVDDFPVTVPESLLDGEGDTEKELDSLSQLLHWFILQFDTLAGQFPIKVKVKGSEELGTNDVDVEMKNIAESLAEIYGLAVNTALDSDHSVNILLKLASEVISAKNAALIAQDLAFANNEFLGMNIKKKKRRVNSAFDVKQIQFDDSGRAQATPGLFRFLNNSSYFITSYENSDPHTAMAMFQELLFAAAIIKGALYRTGKVDPNGEGALDLIRDIRNPDTQYDDGEWDKFLLSLEVPTDRSRTTHLRRDIDEISINEAGEEQIEEDDLD
ncbi:MAG: hypothetical protein ACFE0J_21530 [Elainellaceae cyanobacterium]